jgi:bifunctional ADP-heptose synthase (sugar kinase/adenylyltransferase)
LSPERRVLLRENERAVLGRAAHVCANLAALGAEVVVGVIGQDELEIGAAGPAPRLPEARCGSPND